MFCIGISNDAGATLAVVKFAVSHSHVFNLSISLQGRFVQQDQPSWAVTKMGWV